MSEEKAKQTKTSKEDLWTKIKKRFLENQSDDSDHNSENWKLIFFKRNTRKSLDVNLNICFKKNESVLVFQVSTSTQTFSSVGKRKVIDWWFSIHNWWIKLTIIRELECCLYFTYIVFIFHKKVVQGVCNWFDEKKHSKSPIKTKLSPYLLQVKFRQNESWNYASSPIQDNKIYDYKSSLWRFRSRRRD